VYVFTLHLKDCDYTNFNLNLNFLALWMSVKFPHNIMVMGLGYILKWLKKCREES
jgi:hypothetical protein